MYIYLEENSPNQRTTLFEKEKILVFTQRSNIEEVVETGASENNVHFCHLLGILKLAWYLKSRFIGTHYT